ncbi:MAG: hypothetical protein IKM42_05930 [Clostridia bacterium]|nr:hypothetical protein [Clostridia bacterium]MBR7112121.1 hypothetical protein [Clostridia bacterium]
MIYIKIYLDKDENGEDILVFDSVKQNLPDYHSFTVAGKKHMTFPLEYDHFVKMTSVIGVDQVAISPEAKEFFLSLLKDESTHEEMPYGQRGDFAMDSGRFAYCPPEIKNGDTRKILRRTDRFTVECIFSQDPLDYMTRCLNETLKSLDLTAPADEKPLLDAYYAEMRARGEELGCDVDTIRKTPLRYLTEAQKEVIRAEYRGLASRYDKQEWNERRDYDHAAMLEDKISEVIIKKYGKVIRD